MQKGVNINGTQLPIEELHLSFLVDKLRNEFGFLESSRSSIPVDGYGNVMPLYSYPCYEYIRSMDWKNANIFEFGCGYSSIWWDNVDANVYGVDSNDEWINKIQSSVSGHLNIRPLYVLWSSLMSSMQCAPSSEKEMLFVLKLVWSGVSTLMPDSMLRAVSVTPSSTKTIGSVGCMMTASADRSSELVFKE